MGIKEDVFQFNQMLDLTIDEVMQVETVESAKAFISEAVQTEVYDVYQSEAFDPYQRKGRQGGLADPEQMSHEYDPATKKLEVFSTRKREEPDSAGKFVADVVESGKGYQWGWNPFFEGEVNDSPIPRPFHKVAEQNMKDCQEVERILRYGLKKVGFTVKKV